MTTFSYLKTILELNEKFITSDQKLVQSNRKGQNYYARLNVRQQHRTHSAHSVKIRSSDCQRKRS